MRCPDTYDGAPRLGSLPAHDKIKIDFNPLHTPYNYLIIGAFFRAHSR